MIGIEDIGVSHYTKNYRNSYCRRCDCLIPKGTPRFYVESKARTPNTRKIYIARRYYCFKCSMIELEDIQKYMINLFSSIKDEFNKQLKHKDVISRLVVESL